MPARSQAKNVIVTLLFTIFGGPGIVGVYLPAAITRWRVSASPGPLRALAWTLIALATVPLVESVARFVWAGRGTPAPFAPTETLVVSGFYRHVRNPMYVGVLAGIAGQAILFRSATLAAYLNPRSLCLSPVRHLLRRTEASQETRPKLRRFPSKRPSLDSPFDLMAQVRPSPGIDINSLI